MKKICMLIVTGLILTAGMVYAGTIGDINGDGKINLTEAVGALQVVSGKRVPAYTSDKTYDTRAYIFNQASGKKIYRQTKFVYNGNAQTGIGVVKYSMETLAGKTVIAKKYESGIWAESDSTDYYIGRKVLGWTNYGKISLFNPAVDTMKDTWALGEKIINMSVLKTSGRDQIWFWGCELLGKEDVTVPAGTFNCLKITVNRSEYGVHEIIYMAKNLGIVKRIRSDLYGRGFIWELMDVEKADGSYMFGKGKNICEVKGTWTADGITCNQGDSNCMNQGVFTMDYIKGDKTVFLALYNFHWDSNAQTLSMITKDGINFSPDPNAYTADNNHDGKPDIPDISLAIDNGNITGTFNTNGQGFTLKGTVTCP